MSNETTPERGIRLQRALAAAGIGSRRACEALIEEGRVAVNGQPVLKQGLRIDPGRDSVTVDGTPVPTRADLRYVVVNKPAGMVSTMTDPEGRPCVGDIVRDHSTRFFHVGRLDSETEGLLLLTNDGDLAQRMQHPSFGLPKVYLAEVAGVPARDVGRRLKEGVDLEDGPARADHFRVVDRVGNSTLLEVTVHEGRNRMVRRLLAAVGLPVQRLVRTQVGPIRLGELRPGRTRVLSAAEVQGLYAATTKQTSR